MKEVPRSELPSPPVPRTRAVARDVPQVQIADAYLFSLVDVFFGDNVDVAIHVFLAPYLGIGLARMVHSRGESEDASHLDNALFFTMRFVCCAV